MQDFKVNANGFTVLNARDGFRKDNSLWFGECSVCGETVSNSRLSGVWEHQVILEEKLFEDGRVFMRKTRQIDYCPAVA